MFEIFLSQTIILFFLMDPLGNIPLFINSLQHLDRKKQQKIILREFLVALIILLFFLFVGKKFLNLLQLSTLSMQIAGASILFLIALKMVFPIREEEEVLKEEPFIVPLAIPAIAGPSAIAGVMIMSQQNPEHPLLVLAVLFAATFISAVILLLAPQIQRLLGKKLVLAIERLMGLILITMAVEIFLKALPMIGAK
jgi:MarC family membrane protein